MVDSSMVPGGSRVQFVVGQKDQKACSPKTSWELSRFDGAEKNQLFSSWVGLLSPLQSTFK